MMQKKLFIYNLNNHLFKPITKKREEKKFLRREEN